MAQKNKPRSGQTNSAKRPAQKNKTAAKPNNKNQPQNKNAQAYKPKQNPNFARPSFAQGNPAQQIPNPMYTRGGNANYSRQYAGQMRNAQQMHNANKQYQNRQASGQQYARQQYYTQQQPYVNQQYYTQQQPYVNQQYYTQQQPHVNQQYYTQQQPHVNQQYYTQQQPHVNQQYYTQQQPHVNQQYYTQQQPYVNQQYYTQQQPHVNQQYYTQQQPHVNQQYYTQQQPHVNQQYYTQQQPHVNQQRKPNSGGHQKKRPPQSQQSKKAQQKPKPKPRKLTPEEIAEQKRLREEAKKRAREEFKKLVDMVVARVMLFLMMFGVLFVFCSGCMFLSLLTGNSPDRSPFTLVITQSIAPLDYVPITERVSYDRTVINGRPYINFSRIAGLYDYITTGDEDVVSFLSDVNAEQKVSFHISSGYFEINGVPGRMAYSVYRIDDEIYVPIDFISDYMTGMTVEYLPDSRTVKLTRENDSKLDSFIKPQFSLHTDAPNTNVAEGSLDDDTLLMTDPYRFTQIPDIYAGLIQ